MMNGKKIVKIIVLGALCVVSSDLLGADDARHVQQRAQLFSKQPIQPIIDRKTRLYPVLYGAALGGFLSGAHARLHKNPVMHKAAQGAALGAGVAGLVVLCDLDNRLNRQEQQIAQMMMFLQAQHPQNK